MDVKHQHLTRLSSVGFKKTPDDLKSPEYPVKMFCSGPQLLMRHLFQHNPAVKDTGLEPDHTRTGTFTLCPDGPFTSCVYSFG